MEDQVTWSKMKGQVMYNQGQFTWLKKKRMAMDLNNRNFCTIYVTG